MTWLQKRLQFYRLAIQGLLILVTVVLVTGLVGTARYFYFQKKHQKSLQSEIQKLHIIAEIEESLILIPTFSLKEKDGQYLFQQESSKIQKFWPEISSSAFNPKILTQVDSLRNFQLEIKNLRSHIKEKIEQSFEHDLSLTFQMMIVALMAFLVGIVAPILVLRFGLREWQKFRVEIEEKAHQIVVQWMENFKSSGDEPFKDPLFWLNTFLLAIETIAPQTKNPMILFLLEFAPALRAEVAKSQQKNRV